MARKSKYKFALLKPGDAIKVDGIDVYSMLNSLTLYNKNNGAALKLEQVGDADRKGKYTFTVPVLEEISK